MECTILYIRSFFDRHTRSTRDLTQKSITFIVKTYSLQVCSKDSMKEYERINLNQASVLKQAQQDYESRFCFLYLPLIILSLSRMSPTAFITLTDRACSPLHHH